MMDVSPSGELSWNTAEAAAPRWCVVLERPPGIVSLFLDPRDASLPAHASVRQRTAFLSTILMKARGQRPTLSTLTLVELGQRYQFHVAYAVPAPQTHGDGAP
jgi:hypothetical protein